MDGEGEDVATTLGQARPDLDERVLELDVGHELRVAPHESPDVARDLRRHREVQHEGIRLETGPCRRQQREEPRRRAARDDDADQDLAVGQCGEAGEAGAGDLVVPRRRNGHQ